MLSIVLQVVVLLPVLSNVAVYSCQFIWISKAMKKDIPGTFDAVLDKIPTRSRTPTRYRPRFFPSCAPDNALNPTTDARIFHFPSLTSIQCAVTPKNPIFVVSADQQSEVIEAFPGDI
jgi:hypothetical protein